MENLVAVIMEICRKPCPKHTLIRKVKEAAPDSDEKEIRNTINLMVENNKLFSACDLLSANE